MLHSCWCILLFECGLNSKLCLNSNFVGIRNGREKEIEEERKPKPQPNPTAQAHSSPARPQAAQPVLSLHGPPSLSPARPSPFQPAQHARSRVTVRSSARPAPPLTSLAHRSARLPFPFFLPAPNLLCSLARPRSSPRPRSGPPSPRLQPRNHRCQLRPRPAPSRTWHPQVG